LQFAEELRRQTLNSSDGQREPLRFDDTELRSHEFDIEIRALTERELTTIQRKSAQRQRHTLIIWLAIVGAIVALYCFAPGR